MDEQAQPPFGRPDTTDEQRPAPGRRRTRRLVAGLAAAALLAGGVGAGYAAGDQNDPDPAGTAASGTGRAAGDGLVPLPGDDWLPPGGGQQDDVPLPADPYDGSAGGSQTVPSDLTANASGSQLTGLVRVVSTMRYDRATAVGTGMVLTSGGEVVTNHHVVARSTSIMVTVMSTGTTYAAKVVGTDAQDDVAVLQLTGASGLSTVTPDRDGVSVGDAVTAVGDANGTADHLSAAKGTVLATRQSITTRSQENATGKRLTGLIEISSDVISGDSGGATYDAEGEVVAMTTAASSGTTDVVGYAVPIAKVLTVADDLEDGVRESRYDYESPAFLGVGLGQTGTTVQGVYEGTPAARAGISAGDRITAVGSTTVRSAAQLHTALGRLSPGDQTSITWTDTSGASHDATVTLAAGPVE